MFVLIGDDYLLSWRREKSPVHIACSLTAVVFLGQLRREDVTVQSLHNYYGDNRLGPVYPYTSNAYNLMIQDRFRNYDFSPHISGLLPKNVPDYFQEQPLCNYLDRRGSRDYGSRLLPPALGLQYAALILLCFTRIEANRVLDPTPSPSDYPPNAPSDPH